MIIYVIGTIGLGMLILGTFYAILIYYSPAPHGWTWVSVAVGDGFTDLGEVALIIAALIHYGQLDAMWPLILIPPVGHLLTGGPMIAGQIIKKRREDKFSNDKLSDAENG